MWNPRTRRKRELDVGHSGQKRHEFKIGSISTLVNAAVSSARAMEPVTVEFAAPARAHESIEAGRNPSYIPPKPIGPNHAAVFHHVACDRDDHRGFRTIT